MNITNRLFTYPILSEDKDDYKESSFQVAYDNTMQGVNSIKLLFDITMNCDELDELIITGKAEYVIHLECSSTAYREVIKSFSKHVEHTVPIGRINGNLDAVAFVILKKNINNFSCTDWIDDYQGISFSLSAGSILAYQNLQSLNITKDYEEFTNANSIFSIYKRVTDDDRPAEINLDSSKIRIGLSTKDYELYAMYATKTDLQYLFHAMIVLPALVYVFEQLSLEENEDMYKNNEWFIALEKAYSKRNINFMDEILNDEKTSFQLAQEAMELPISKAFSQIPMFFNIAEED